MVQSKTARRLVVAAVTTLVAACQDGTPSDPIAPSLERSARAQERLEAVFQRISPEVLDLPGTVYADNDEASGRLVVGVESMGAARGVQNAMERLGVATADYEVKLASPIHFMASLQTRFGTKVGGIQINFPGYLCTLGFNADFGTTKSFVTNSHCTTTQGGVESTPYWQPLQSVDGTQIATEVADPVYVKNAPGCSRGKKCRRSDASRANYVTNNSNVTFVRGQIARPDNLGSLNVSGSNVFTVTSQDTSSVTFSGSYDKVGRTTGWTRGTAGSTCVNVNVSGSTIQLICQTLVSSTGTIVGSGDSGSGVFRSPENGSTNVALVGLLWGGSGDGKMFVFSPLKNVKDELGAFNAVQ